MVHCCVPYCNSQQGKTAGVSFHEFPILIADKWVEAVNRQGTTTSLWWPADRSTVCSLHFKDEDFRTGLKLRRLKDDAIPSIFPCYPAHSTRKLQKLRRTSNEHEDSAPSKRKKSTTPQEQPHTRGLTSVTPSASPIISPSVTQSASPSVSPNVTPSASSSVSCQTEPKSRKVGSLKEQLLKTLKRVRQVSKHKGCSQARGRGTGTATTES